ncbi:HNH endonuclease, partial [Priestia aryabhattai]
GFNFEEVYGERGRDFIEIHHIKPLSSLKEAVAINPKTDLVPLCANCHRMIHRRKNEVLTVEQLKALTKKLYTELR